MTTAPDLPLEYAQVPPGADLAPALAPYAEPTTTRPRLTVVPSQPLAEPVDFEEALRRAVPRLKRYAVRRLLDDHEAEEVVQEAMLRAFQHKDELATEDDLMAWLTVVTGRLVIDRLRVRGRSTPMAELPPESRAGRDTADVVVARDEARVALDALEAMPTRQAAVLWAREVEGLSYDEIGDRFGMTEPSVRSVLHRARRTLRREYALRGGTLPGVGLVALAPWLLGLRSASTLRHVARRTVAAATVAATGLVVATVVPFGAHTTRIHQIPALQPAFTVRTASSTGTHTTHIAAAHTANNPTAATVPAVHDGADFEPVLRHSPFCNGRVAGKPISAGCQTHHTPTVYVTLPVPVAGTHQVGVTSSKLVCRLVPATGISECDISTPSKGTQK
jgi:RNA polymerase sigma factor (sigma-70 family)